MLLLGKNTEGIKAFEKLNTLKKSYLDAFTDMEDKFMIRNIEPYTDLCLAFLDEINQHAAYQTDEAYGLHSKAVLMWSLKDSSPNDETAMRNIMNLSHFLKGTPRIMRKKIFKNFYRGLSIRAVSIFTKDYEKGVREHLLVFYLK